MPGLASTQHPLHSSAGASHTTSPQFPRHTTLGLGFSDWNSCPPVTSAHPLSLGHMGVAAEEPSRGLQTPFLYREHGLISLLTSRSQTQPWMSQVESNVKKEIIKNKSLLQRHKHFSRLTVNSICGQGRLFFWSLCRHLPSGRYYHPVYLVLGIESRASWMLGNCSTN